MTDNTQAHMQLAGATPSAGVLLHSTHATSALLLITSEHRQQRKASAGAAKVTMTRSRRSLRASAKGVSPLVRMRAVP